MGDPLSKVLGLGQRNCGVLGGEGLKLVMGCGTQVVMVLYFDWL